MKKLATIISLIGLSTCAFAIPDKPAISGTIKGFGNDTIFVRVIRLDVTGTRIDTLKASNDKFIYPAKVTEPSEFTIYSKKCMVKRENGRYYTPDTRMIKVVVKPGASVVLTGSFDGKILTYSAKGDELNETFAQRRTAVIQQKAELVRKELALDSLSFHNMEEKVLDMLDADLEQKRLENQQTDIEYIRTHPDKDLSAYYMSALPMDTVLKYITKLSPAVRKGLFATGLNNQEEQLKRFKAVQEAQAKVAVGTTAPDFTLKSLQGTPVSLSSFKGKYVVIDFWGAWCYWCMKGVPQMKEYYAKYKDKVEFIGVDVRDKEDLWKSTVEKQGMNWVHVQNLTPTDVPVLYGVSGYPTKLILDPDLKIVARIIGESPEFYQKLDELLK